jgi:CHASE1-domain containing sensor protein
MNALNEKSMSLLRKYIFEVVMFSLCTAVVYLFWTVSDLQLFIRNDLINDKIILTKTIEKNTEAINDFINEKRK